MMISLFYHLFSTDVSQESHPTQTRQDKRGIMEVRVHRAFNCLLEINITGYRLEKVISSGMRRTVHHQIGDGDRSGDVASKYASIQIYGR